MKIRVTEESLTHAIQRLIGVDIIIDTVDEARRALNLILERTDTSKTPEYKGIEDIKISQRVEHATTAMEHKNTYVIEFILTDETQVSMEIALIQELQKIFRQPVS